MLHFFRKIRKSLLSNGKTAKYLTYALGEIVLVVIGILIALQINNWNEERKNDAKEIILIKNIVEDLKVDSIHIQQSLGELSNQLKIVNYLIAKAIDSTNFNDAVEFGLIRYSSDFRPITQKNHSIAISNLENENTREIIQNYFLKEEQVKDIFLEYESVIHNKIRPYLSEVGMHNLTSLYNSNDTEIVIVKLNPKILENQINTVFFQQLLYERSIKTIAFKKFLTELKYDNQSLINTLSKKSMPYKTKKTL